MRNSGSLFLISFALAALAIPFVRQLAFGLGILDHPKKHGIHTRPVPRLGGLAIYLAFVAGSIYRMDLSEMLKGVLVGSTLIFVMGLLDDKFHLPAGVKLVGQIAACGLMMFKYGVILHLFPHPALNAVVTMLGIIGLTNAMNFLDNMDGLAAGLATISSLAIFFVACTSRQLWLGYLSLAIAGATAGFLTFNLRKAYIFMGDAGSTFLGFTLASLAVMTEWSYHWPVTVAVPVLILGVPILDMILITVLRIKEDKIANFKEWIDYTGKDHISHRIMRLGFGERGAVFSLWLLQGFFCAVALWILPLSFGWGVFALLLFFSVCAGTLLFFRKKRVLTLGWNRRIPGRQALETTFTRRSKGKMSQRKRMSLMEEAK